MERSTTWKHPDGNAAANDMADAEISRIGHKHAAT
jgi:hypothetical protein